LTVHSIFHLLGYDHIEEADKAIMREKEEKIMNAIGLSR
jgi:probable rRNA maturation factor